MTTETRNNIQQGIIGILSAAVIALVGWMFATQSKIALLETSQEEILRTRQAIGEINAAMSEFRVSVAEVRHMAQMMKSNRQLIESRTSENKVYIDQKVQMQDQRMMDKLAALESGIDKDVARIVNNQENLKLLLANRFNNIHESFNAIISRLPMPATPMTPSIPVTPK